MTRAALTLSLMLALVALPLRASEMMSSVEVPRPTASVGTPAPTARTCKVEIDGLSPVVSTCSLSCYLESWEGPLLHATNACESTIWVSYVFDATDGRTWRTPCYELAGGETAVVAEAAMEPGSRRRVLVAVEPGLGWPVRGFRAQCPDEREQVVEQPEAGSRE